MTAALLEFIPRECGHGFVTQQRVLGHEDLFGAAAAEVRPGVGLREQPGNHPGPEPGHPLVPHLVARQQAQEVRLAGPI